ncbi:MAG: nucleotidyltransferase domain-containing protein [bacterium]
MASIQTSRSNPKTPHWSSDEKLVIDSFAERVRRTFKERARRIILYGSRARGAADEESDYDFLVLLEPFERQQDKESLRNLALQVSLEHGTCVIAFATRARDFTEEKYFYFFENVCKEGIDL